jgi:hypothetical protein
MVGVAGDHSSAWPIIEVDSDERKAAPSYRVDEIPVGGHAIDCDPDAQTATGPLEPELLDEVLVKPRYLVRVSQELSAPAPTFTFEGHLDIGTAAEVEPPAAAGEGARFPSMFWRPTTTVYLRPLLRPRKWSSIKCSSTSLCGGDRNSHPKIGLLTLTIALGGIVRSTAGRPSVVRAIFLLHGRRSRHDCM